jgi:hypothetical protein
MNRLNTGARSPWECLGGFCPRGETADWHVRLLPLRALTGPVFLLRGPDNTHPTREVCMWKEPLEA